MDNAELCDRLRKLANWHVNQNDLQNAALIRAAIRLIEGGLPASAVTMHTIQNVDGNTDRVRVPGGWLYRFSEGADGDCFSVACAFVPES